MRKLKKSILAEGELTGHSHKLSDNTEVFETEEKTRIFDLVVSDTIKHEEHKEIELKPNEYESDKVIEYDHFAEEARRVQD